MTTYRTQLRFPDASLPERVKRLAKERQRSMNAQIIRLIEKGLEHEQKAATQ